MGTTRGASPQTSQHPGAEQLPGSNAQLLPSFNTMPASRTEKEGGALPWGQSAQ